LLIPVASTTAAIPPYPIASASAAAHRRVTRSSITPRSRAYFARTASTASILHEQPPAQAPYFHQRIDNFERAP
jgi:hypothetical protein